MVQICAVSNCKIRKRDDVRFFSCPRGKTKLNRHFCQDEFEVGIKTCIRRDLHLKPNAVPHLFLGYQQPDMPCYQNFLLIPVSNSLVLENNNTNYPQLGSLDVDPLELESIKLCEGCTVSSTVVTFSPEDLYEQLKQLQEENLLLKEENKQLKQLEKENLQLKEKIDFSEAQLSSFLNPDQKKYLRNQTGRGGHWSPETIMKACKIRAACGAKGYQVLIEMSQPLPFQRTLHRYFEFQPIPSKKKKTDSFKAEFIIVQISDDLNDS